ncbi:unnamed protein product, partial [Iphiclides podalirius]
MSYESAFSRWKGALGIQRIIARGPPKLDTKSDETIPKGNCKATKKNNQFNSTVPADKRHSKTNENWRVKQISKEFISL